MNAGFGNVEQLGGMIDAFVAGDGRRFFGVLKQIAARAARSDGPAAEALRALIEVAQGRAPRPSGLRPLPHASDRGELLLARWPETRLDDLTLDEDLRRRLEKVLREQEHRARLRAAGLRERRKLLAVGPPGCGKTRTAHVLAGELGLALYTVRLESLLSQFMGESIGRLHTIFERIRAERAVYLFDEFDSIGSSRESNDVGEIKRVLSAFLLYVEADDGESVIVASTNNPHRLDYALFRRFDDLLEYEMPTVEQITHLLRALLGEEGGAVAFQDVASAAVGLSYAEVVLACEAVRKLVVIEEREGPTTEDLLSALAERSAFYARYVAPPRRPEAAMAER